ncbi:hypothetical protein RhiirA4_473568 [Rhizophagus irregularis]|uniref:Protein kinase domain-containing protein n=1 Tax=Rhizophagus irregularis TaxID=588596 RepID=A0A2I1H6Y5_9GLOM|nr:hypothetical protein RhiirA4_473568 [Rhizophagus irregularis]
MELRSYNENSFNPTSRLKSSTEPIQFIFFNNRDDYCSYCRSYYSVTTCFRQKYCENCLSVYINNTAIMNIGVHISTRSFTQCDRHEPRNLNYCIRNIQEWCNSCSKILYFEQIVTNYKYDKIEDWMGINFSRSDIYCNLCGKLINGQISSDTTSIEFKSCSDCCQSQCKKCNRILSITINIINAEEEIFVKKIKTNCYNQIANYMDYANKNSNPLEVYNFINKLYIPSKTLKDWVLYSKISNLENDEPIGIFIPFNNNEETCYYCKTEYSTTILFKQKYCRHCLFLYIKYTSNNNLGALIIIDDDDDYAECGRHEPRDENFCSQNVQEWCNSCSEILYFNQIVTNHKYCKLDYYMRKQFNKSETYCNLCGKLINGQISSDTTSIEFKLCSDCYQVSSGWIESTLTKKAIPILYLPWWDASDQCIYCDQFLESKSDYYKCCLSCYITYIGCRYCLTTNIIFGITNQSQCKKCNRILSITINIINAEEEIFVKKIKTNCYNQIANYMDYANKNSNPLEVYNFINKLYIPSKTLKDWVLYSKISNLENDEPIGIFIPFNNNEETCYYCKTEYSTTILFKQKYCRHCLFLYIKYTSNNNLGALIIIDDDDDYAECGRHEPRDENFCSQNVQEWCNSCSEILYFNQIVTNHKYCKLDYYMRKQFNKSETYCNLCGKLINGQISSDTTSIEFKLCSDCYQVSSGWIESTLTKKAIPILYLPWWDASDQCISCDQFLESKSDYLKWCLSCFIIYIGCRYCLTTNIIFGITNQSQCKKCNRILSITINIIIYNFINKLYIPSKTLKDWVLYSQISNLENDKNIIIPSIPIIFFPFNNNEVTCYYCKRKYSITILFKQKYCRHCLFLYIKYTSNNNLDVLISIADNIQCDGHEPRNKDFCTQNIQEWCKSCSEILYFKQIVTNHKYDKLKYCKLRKSEIYCKLCEKLVNVQILSNTSSIEFKLCSNCHQVSSGWIESTLTEKAVPILYLPWWDASDQCINCDQSLEIKSDYYKCCLSCYITYIGCRYCLTTNIIFGITNQSQCKKCNKILSITSINIINAEEESFVKKIKTHYYKHIANYMDYANKNSNPLEIYNFINKLYIPFKTLTDWVLYPQISKLENDENIIIPSIPIILFPFNNNEETCYYCKRKYSITPLFKQKYCRHCLFLYIKYTFNNNLDVLISIADNIQCDPRNKDFCTQNIQEWCKSCSKMLYFNQIVTNHMYYDDTLYSKYYHIISELLSCNLYGNLVNQQISLNTNIELKLCSDCYQVFSGWIESTLTKKTIPILYLPWWDASDQCISCDQSLESKSDCQKWCLSCFTIYMGCRNCLSTNIIFGITDQSQCRKCRRVMFINKIDINANEVTYDLRSIDNNSKSAIANYMNSIDNNFNPIHVYNFVRKIFLNSRTDKLIKRVPYSQIANIEQVAKGGYGTIHKATWFGKEVAIKRFSDSQYIRNSFLNEVESFLQCSNLAYIIKVYGITQDHNTKDYMLIMEYANGGDLHKYLQKKFVDITWNKKLHILWKISEGLNAIHKKNFIHRDFHSGNILSSSYQSWLICDLGLSQPSNSTLSNNEIYGVIPYIAPEIFKGSEFSKESDIYSMGMIMWELTTGCKPFANIDHDVNLIYNIIYGKQPEITNDTPECFANLMKRCWNPDPSKRPLISEITESFSNWYYKDNSVEQFKQAESKRLELIESEQLGPEFSEKSHPGAIYTSRSLNSILNPSSTCSLNDIKLLEYNDDDDDEYISNECGLDIYTSGSKKRDISEISQIETQDRDDFDVVSKVQKLNN